jgi:hypothetical protein
MSPQARRRTAGSKKDDAPAMKIEWEGRTYLIREADLTPRDIAALRRETGFAGWLGLSVEAQRGFDLDVLAALLWLARRTSGETVSFESVLDEMSYTADINISVEDKRGPKAAEVEADSPEA